MEISSSEDEPPETSLQKALKSKKPENTLKRYILLLWRHRRISFVRF